ncbi:hypothetical protein POM88_048411 [Heracleum sosnowskyi]|uniref:Uncharacterized protein n=1 Tax=Heracleum sosnowskyi TaxID=360622 RepID=A0AAD8LYG2_9APIA|nr:hypothetical protein POM88_048411 [Heracleum sosnowskyi]
MLKIDARFWGEVKGNKKIRGDFGVRLKGANSMQSSKLREEAYTQSKHSCVAGLIWALIKFRWGLHLPKIVDKSLTILSDGGLGMAMFSLGLFMASRAGIKSSEILRAIDAKKDYTTDEESDEADGEGDEEGSSVMMAISRCSFKLYLK